MSRMTGAVALTREVSAAMGVCELTHLPRSPIDIGRARRQHAAYEAALADAGYQVVRLSGSDEMPDCVFIEDTAVVLDDVAIVTRPGAVSRRAETPAVAEELSRHRALRQIEPPATVDGGDVLVIGRRLFWTIVEDQRRRHRTDAKAAGAAGYTVHATEVTGCLHLKSAVTAVDAETVLVNPDWIDSSLFDAYDVIAIDRREPYGANVLGLRVGVIVPASFPWTAERISSGGRRRVVTVDAGELAKAEGAVTCCSLILDSIPYSQ
jgi:dimethylargininase